MTDELTPEERDALRSLPKERMPVGLEGRVVEAMREHGFLEKKRRAITVTSGRVAGVLAASVALMIAAYSIGLQRGGDRAIPDVATVPPRQTAVPETSAIATPSGDTERSSSSETPDADRLVPKEPVEKQRSATDEAREAEESPATERERRDISPSKLEGASEPAPSPSARSEETSVQGATGNEAADYPLTSGEAKADGHVRGGRTSPVADVSADRVLQTTPKERRPTETGSDVTAKESLQDQPFLKRAQESLGVTQAQPTPTATLLSKQPLTYRLNGSTVIVEAPDSVRITQDEGGRVLVIYTTDGVIRIRLANE